MDTLPASTHIDLRCFPSADEEFTEHVYAAAAGFAFQPPTCEDLEDRIKARYPRAAVRRKTALAAFGPEHTVWYVFREAGA